MFSSNDSNIREKGDANNSGLALVGVLLLVTVMTSMIAAHLSLARIDLKLASAIQSTQGGFNIAEAGLNIRAKEIKNKFINFQRPEGVSPTNGVISCDSGNIGSDDFRCKTYDLGSKQSAVTYVVENESNPIQTVVPPGRVFGGLSSLDYRYNVTSVGRDQNGENEAILKLKFTSRIVPMFQFAAFFNQDLEFFAGASMTVNGPVHTNGDLYLSSQTGGSLLFTSAITSGGDIYRGMKTQSTCQGQQGTIKIMNPYSEQVFYGCNSSRTLYDNDDFLSWNGNITSRVDGLNLPSINDLEPYSNGAYWQNADMRVVLKLDSDGNPDTALSPTGIVVLNVDGSIDVNRTNRLHNQSNCPSVDSETGGLIIGSKGMSYGNRLRLYREYQYDSSLNYFERTLEVDTRRFLRCINDEGLLDGAKRLDDDTHGGLVIYLTIDGPLSGQSHNNYAVRLRNSEILQADSSYAHKVKGLTFATDQKMVVWGDFNSDVNEWIPSSLVGDSMYLLSNNWKDQNSEQSNRYYRVGSNTTVRAGVYSGVAHSGGVNGVGGQDKGYNTNGGGVINIFRFNEWFRCDSYRGSYCSSGQSYPNFVYEGSFVSLNAPRKSQSTWGPFTYYSAPNRKWSFDTRFTEFENLPPLTPQFTFLSQDLFAREYEISVQ